ncbi:unnamed protein product [Notodromas monacha]|uniref:phosphoethanolamine N-methyltransferase n=1 Tax=Notodromas monacha TaxID=399045 RepID=A0A7R9GDT8_9CRUS|nr:unnamed protein product [Notodromas monacha]CAG0918894.1 unnamed protein product [Notodromas monacha]
MPSVVPRWTSPFRTTCYGDETVRQLLLQERIIGQHHVFHGGLRLVKEVASLALPRHPAPGTRVLNVGGGFGGFAFHLADTEPNVSVAVCDPNEAVASEARLRLSQHFPHLSRRVSIQCSGVDELEEPPGSWDAIVCFELNSFHMSGGGGSRRTLLMDKFKRWLSPGGKLVLVDYCWSCRVLERLQEAALADGGGGSAAMSRDDYATCLKAVFSHVWVDDRTDSHLGHIRDDLGRLKHFLPGSRREERLKADCVAQWRNLEKLLSDETLTWILACATSPSARN